MLIIKEVSDKTSWEHFVLNQEEKTFLHSWNWGEFNASLGSKIFRLGIYDDGTLVGVALIIKVSARRGTFLFCPQGPIFSDRFRPSVLNLQLLIDYLRDLAVGEGCDFIRMSPALENDKEGHELFKSLGFRAAPIHMHAELMWILDLSVSEEKLLKDMRKTTRYSIKKAERDGVRIIKDRNPEDVLKFNEIYKETAGRHHFTPYSLDYLKKEFDAFSPDDEIAVFFAEFKGEFIAGAIIVFYNGSAFYHQGASSSKYSQIPAAYLLQWEAIKEAKSRGCKLYNFWGISDECGNHPWAGLTLFKKGFGGFSKEYLPAQDLPLTPLYWISFIVEKIRKVRRHL